MNTSNSGLFSRVRAWVAWSPARALAVFAAVVFTCWVGLVACGTTAAVKVQGVVQPGPGAHVQTSPAAPTRPGDATSPAAPTLTEAPSTITAPAPQHGDGPTEIAYGYVTAWLTGRQMADTPTEVTAWRDGVAKFVSPGLAAEVRSLDKAKVPAATVTTVTDVRSAGGTASATVVLSDSTVLAVRLIHTDAGWRVAAVN